jgi:hypothetical protein
MVKIYELKKAGEQKNLGLALFGYFLIGSIFFAWIIYIYLFFVYGILVKGIILGLILYQLTITKRSEWFINFLEYCELYNYFKSYTIVLEEDVQDTKSLLCIHPHGIIGLSMGSMIVSGLSFMKRVVVCGTRFVRYLPVSGIVARWVGIEGVNHTNFKTYMKEGKNIIFIPGGFECATITSDREDRTYIKNRKGFIKYALRYGYAVHPIYNFGENKLFYTINGFERLGLILNKLKFPGCLFYGKYGILPRNDIDICCVIGKAMRLPIIAEPSEDDIEKYHKLYLDELSNLYQRHCKKYGGSEKLKYI